MSARAKSQQVERHLIRWHAITPLIALRLYGCYRLGSVIHRLRKKGWQITTARVGKEGYANYVLVKAVA